jgi:hypothetical protein
MADNQSPTPYYCIDGLFIAVFGITTLIAGGIYLVVKVLS